MAQGAKRLTDIQEQDWSQAVWWAVWGVLLFLAAAGAIFMAQHFIKPLPALGWPFFVLGTLLALAGAAALILSVQRFVRGRTLKTVPFTCPYCGGANRFLATPTEDFECECCHRRVHFKDGKPVAVQTIVCQQCRAEHRVAVTVDRYVCDRCNRPLRITNHTLSGPVLAAVDSQVLAEQDRAATQHQDVLILAYDRRKEQGVAFKVQDLLLVNMVEARRLLQTATAGRPLVVAHDVPPMKAAALRAELEQAGATASTRTTASPQAQRAR